MPLVKSINFGHCSNCESFTDTREFSTPGKILYLCDICYRMQYAGSSVVIAEKLNAILKKQNTLEINIGVLEDKVRELKKRLKKYARY